MNKLTEDKKYYRIGEVAKRVGKTPQTIKRWEEAGKISKAKKSKSSGWRVYTEEQVKVIEKYALSVE